MSNIFETSLKGHKFTFQPFNAGHLNGYHVDVKDEDGARHEFRMEQEDDSKWTLQGENLPSWITDLADELREAIENNS